MPNWVMNRVSVSGDEKDIKAFKELVEYRSEDDKFQSVTNPFSLNRVIPMPDTLVGDEWYWWRINHWGTKWDTCETSILTVLPTELYYEFQTAWSAPVEVYKNLCKRFPNLDIQVLYADEDLGYNCGVIDADDGAVFMTMKDYDFEFACEVWGYDPDEMRELYEM